MRQMMNNADNTQDRALTTEQIATAGTAPLEDEPVMADDEGYAADDESYAADNEGYDDNAAGLVADQPASRQTGRGAPDAGDGGGSVAAGSGSRAMLLEDGELQSITMRWKDIQAEFVDEPKTAVQEADALVAELMQRLASMFATERAELEDRWAGGNEVSTEDLRQGLRRYRSFFERLLAA
jgi:hypothetical protein